jgi:hypothetical protein
MLSEIDYKKFREGEKELNDCLVGFSELISKEVNDIYLKLEEIKENWIKNCYRHIFLTDIIKNEYCEILKIKEKIIDGFTYCELYCFNTLESVFAYRFDTDNINHITIKYVYNDIFIDYNNLRKMYGR